ncbi:hypothetical protein QQF64_022040, partial [Cirrhinus molitorella]
MKDMFPGVEVRAGREKNTPSLRNGDQPMMSVVMSQHLNPSKPFKMCQLEKVTCPAEESMLSKYKRCVSQTCADVNLTMASIFAGAHYLTYMFTAQEVYSALPLSDCEDYDTVKTAILKAYELVPEAYRQKFRTLSKGIKEAHVEFVRELITAFNRWCTAAEVLKLLHIKHNKASAYHAQSQGALERFHQTLKSLLRSYCTEMKGDWEEGLPWLMMSAREDMLNTKAETQSVLLVESTPTVCLKEESDEGVSFPEDTVLLGRLKNSETLKNLHKMLVHLPESKCADLVALINCYVSLFGDVPSRTHWLEHDIDVGDAEPIRQHFYRVSPNKLLHLKAEVQYMLDNEIAQPSFSSWSSPCLLVNKSDGTYRFCTDYRKINKVTKPDSFPLPRIEDCVDRVGNAPATFQRLMNKVVLGLEGVAVYLDNVVVFSDSWDQHLSHIENLFARLEEAGLTVNLAKCEFAKATVTYLGKVVGQGCVRPIWAKVEAINRFPPPSTKKELMRFLGLEAFEAAKLLLVSAPVLAAPWFDRPFRLCVDASNVGAGAVLLQADDSGIHHPPLIVYTDHNPLIYLHSLKCPNQRLTRWFLFLQSYALDIRHIKGIDNVVADA